jgi:hypothetical protein
VSVKPDLPEIEALSGRILSRRRSVMAERLKLTALSAREQIG